jgi:hypothetical protein
LAFADRTVASLLQPDYTLSVEQLYEAWTVSHIKSTRSLDILRQILPHKSPNLQLPSFVPDWTAGFGNARSVTNSVWLLRLSHLSLYNACGDLTTTVQHSPRCLKIHGAIIDTIDTITLHGTGTEAMFDETHEFAGLFTQSRDVNPDRRMEEEAYWLTMFSGLRRNQHT